MENLSEIEENLRKKARDTKWKPIDIFQPIRVAITGRLASPPLFNTIEVLGKELALHRLTNAIKTLN